MATDDRERLARLRARARIVRAIRRFFDEAGFIEVDTPVALTAPAPEPHIEAPKVHLRAGTTMLTRFLQPSPELPMKRLLAAGWDRIFQIACVFRDGDTGPLHRPEFRLLEWYRRGAGWESLLDDCEGLLRTTARAAGRGLRFNYRGQAVDLSGSFRRMKVDAAFRAHAGFSILDALERATLQARLATMCIRYDAADTWSDLFHRVFLSTVEPALLHDARPLFLTHYPLPLSALARACPDDPRCSERFELFAGGLELANGFGELTDPAEQRRRFDADRKARLRAGMNDYPIDERFLSALAALPPSAGIALGLDRLLMLMLNADNLDEVAFIPWSET